MSYQREIEGVVGAVLSEVLRKRSSGPGAGGERQALRQCQRENQELNAHNQVTSDNFTDKSFPTNV